MKHIWETFGLPFFTLCVSGAVGTWIGFSSLHLFALAKTQATEIPKIEKVSHPVKPETPAPHDSARVPILVYHSVRPHIAGESAHQELYDITPETLKTHLAYLEETRYTAISFDALADYFDAGVPLPEKPVILTFDDGWENQFEYAFPLLKEFHTTATFFIFTNAIGRGSHLTWDQLREMKDAGISIEAHTKFHPYLTKITDSTRLADEIGGSKKILEDTLETPVTTLAYPFGLYNDAIAAETMQAGFRVARSLRGGTLQNADERYELRASLATDSFAAFKQLLEQ